MKKALLLACILLCAAWSTNAQTYKYNTTEFAYHIKMGEEWSEWSEWEACRCMITINFDLNEIDIYSDVHQKFTIYASEQEWTEESNGSKQIELACTDVNGLHCSLRLRVQSNGIIQLYVDYNDISYVYNLKEL